MQKVILASGSLNRKMLMDALNIPYEIIPAEIEALGKAKEQELMSL